ncbi:MAG: DUF58 domain-containing protein [Alphaproteobacteria bacterium]|nr:DUF58 domain-containing protein [Alphaproteobacteria bacterium]
MGGHRSRRVGQAIEFADYQEYLPGMDLRGLDWRVWGRSDRYVVKRFETETELPCAVVLDLSGDTGTGKAGLGGYPDLDRSKAGYAITLAATLLYWLHRHGEPVGLEVVAGTGMPFSSLPTRGGRNHLQLCFLVLASAKAGGVAGLGDALARVGERVRRRSWVAVITDGMEEPSTWLPSLSAFARRGADVRFLHLFDPGEYALDEDRPVLFYSPEGGDTLAVDPVGAREAFGEVVAEYVDEVKGGVVRFGGRYLPASTGQPLETLLRRVIRGAA